MSIGWFRILHRNSNRPVQGDFNAHMNSNGSNVKTVIVAAVPEINRNISSLFAKFKFDIIGSTTSLDEAHTILRKSQPEGIVYFLDVDINEVLTAFQIFDELPQTPILLLGQLDALIKVKLKKLKNPTMHSDYPLRNPFSVLNRFKSLILGDTDNSDIFALEFINHILNEIYLLTPRTYKKTVKALITQVFQNVEKRNSNFVFDQNTLTIFYSIDVTEIKTQQMILLVSSFALNEFIQLLDKNIDEHWSHSLVQDAILQVLIKFGNKNQKLLQVFIDQFDDLAEYKSTLNLPTGSKDEQLDVHVGLITLENDGPVLKKFIGSGSLFDPVNVAQLVLLVGQGESYREGIYGPVPFNTPVGDYVTIIASKKMKSDTLTDERMGGTTLALCVGIFHRSLVKTIKVRKVFKTIFYPFLEKLSVNDIDENILSRINQGILNYLQDNTS